MNDFLLYLREEVPEFFIFRTLFLLKFTEDDVLLEDAAFQKFIYGGFRVLFSSVITSGVLIQREVRVKGLKWKILRFVFSFSS